MNANLRQRILNGCAAEIARSGPSVGLSFYVSFRNKNDEPGLLMQVAEWWLLTHQLDHFEKATKIRCLVEEMD